MKHLKYLQYVLKHKLYVLVYGWQLGIPWLALLHDNSKFQSAEWFPYADNFFRPDGSKNRSPSDATRERFKEAFQHHWMRNKHHWQYWCAVIDWGYDDYRMEYDESRPRMMPDRYRREMLADWRGAGRAINGLEDALGWYRQNRDKIVLHPETRLWIERQLGYSG